MIASVFLLFVAAGIVIGSIVIGFGGLGSILVALTGLALLTLGVGHLISRHHPS